jgi:multiple sugar transport system permease protein
LSQTHLQMAGASIMFIPILIVFLLLQRHFIEGIAMSGLKG